MGKTVFKLTDEQKNQLVSLYNEGKMDSEIAQIFNVTSGAIYYWRKKLGLQTKFSYSKISKIDNDRFEELFNQGLSDYKIAEILGMSPDGVFSHRQRHGYTRDKLIYAKEIPLTDDEKSIILGIMLGDGYMRKFTNAAFKTTHGPKQKDYSYYIASKFQRFNAKVQYRKRKTIDKRTGKYYESYDVVIGANPAFNEFYDSMYTNKIKHIPFDLLEKYCTEETLAYWFMDDGCKAKSSYELCINCFQLEELIELQKFFMKRFAIDTTIIRDNVLYIRASSKIHFTNLIKDYIIPSMRYKLHDI